MTKAALFLLAPTIAAQAGLSDPAGIWQLNNSFGGASPAFTALDASTLTPGSDYSFATDGNYDFLQTQPFAPATKRLTVTNPIGANGGPGATRTNSWTVVMDVKFDAFQPFSGILQLDPANAADVTIYLYSADNLTAALNSNLSTPGAIAVNTWYRLAFTCGNDGNGGATTMKFYINGVPNGTRTGAFNGILSLQPTFHLFSDNNSNGNDLKPAKLGSLGFWGEELGASDIASLGGPRPEGLPGQPIPGTIATAAPFAHGANTGWIHGKPAVNGLVIGGYSCSGFAHGSNTGWINFGDGTPANRIRYSNTDGADSGVNHDGAGNLSGLAWGANIGWINFGTGSTGLPRPLSDPNRPRLDLLTGEFSGYAHAANTGWIRLSGLRTSSIHLLDEDGDGIADVWEREKFGNLTTANAASDTDHDGTKDKDEYLADTDPHDTASRPRITQHNLQFFPSEGYNNWSVTFTSSPRRLYQVETSTDLGLTIPWADASGSFAGAAGATTSRTVSVQPSAKNFLRVKPLLPLQP